MDWIELKTLDHRYFSKPLQLNNTQFIVATDIDGSPKELDHGLFIYDIMKDKWSLFIEYEDNATHSFPSLAMDINKNIVYMVDSNNKLLIIDIENKKYETISNIIRTGMYSPLTVINNKLHLFTGSVNKKHLIWNENNKIFDEFHTFHELTSGNTNPGLIHLPSTNMVYLFGGDDGLKFIDKIWCYSNDTQKWKILDIKLPKKMKHFGYAITGDQRYIIISGGLYLDETKAEVTNKIFILDLNEMKIIESSVLCPIKSLYHAQIMPHSNDKLVKGYIHQQMLLNDIIIPTSIIKLICNWYSNDYLHLLKDYNHWKINLRKLLPQRMMDNTQ